MKKNTKSKKQVIVVPTTQKTIKLKTKPAKSLAKTPRPTRSKANTLAYYHCFVDQIANPLNDKKKITQISSYCRCKKGEVATARQEHKQQLVKQLAKNYLAFGESLGHYLHADIVGCAKELKK
jgi:hypothetical protein